MEGTKEGKISYFKQHNRLIGEHFLILWDNGFMRAVPSPAMSKIRADMGESCGGGGKQRRNVTGWKERTEEEWHQAVLEHDICELQEDEQPQQQDDFRLIKARKRTKKTWLIRNKVDGESSLLTP